MGEFKTASSARSCAIVKSPGEFPDGDEASTRMESEGLLRQSLQKGAESADL